MLISIFTLNSLFLEGGHRVELFLKFGKLSAYEGQNLLIWYLSIRPEWLGGWKDVRTEKIIVLTENSTYQKMLKCYKNVNSVEI